ncbi:hypothetical protein [Streptomyces rubiginosohelvolus]
MEALQEIIDATGVVPVLNQVETHPYLAQTELREFEAKHNIKHESYSPLGSGQGDALGVLQPSLLGEDPRPRGDTHGLEVRIVRPPGGLHGALQRRVPGILLAQCGQRGGRHLIRLGKHRMGRGGVSAAVSVCRRPGVPDELGQQDADLGHPPLAPDAFGGP